MGTKGSLTVAKDHVETKRSERQKLANSLWMYVRVEWYRFLFSKIPGESLRGIFVDKPEWLELLQVIYFRGFADGTKIALKDEMKYYARNRGRTS